MGCHKHVTVDRLLFSYSVANNIELTQSVMLVVSIQSKGLHSAGYFGQLTACTASLLPGLRGVEVSRADRYSYPKEPETGKQNVAFNYFKTPFFILFIQTRLERSLYN